MTLSEFVRNNLSEEFKERIKVLMERLGIEHVDRVRATMYRDCKKFIDSIGPENKDVLEISGGRFWNGFDFKSFTKTEYPGFDICEDVLDRKFDLIIADQVFEHLLWPYRAGKNVYEMLRPGGYFIVATPFLVKVHNIPHDCSRWTETGIKYFLAECGFPFLSSVDFRWKTFIRHHGEIAPA